MNYTHIETKKFQRFPWAAEPGWVAVPKWIRVIFNYKTIADSRKVMLMRGKPPVYYFPREDVDANVLKTNDTSINSIEEGEITYWDVKVGEKQANKAAWRHSNLHGVSPFHLEHYVAFDWNAMDKWLEEDEVIRVHPRDPYTRVDVINSSRHVEVFIEGKPVVDSKNPVLLFETGLPTRYYFRQTDINMDLLKSTDHHTSCPYKGNAGYFSFVAEDNEIKNIAWIYRFPVPEMYKIKDMVAFFSERLEHFQVDGQLLSTPRTQWSEHA